MKKRTKKLLSVARCYGSTKAGSLLPVASSGVHTMTLVPAETASNSTTVRHRVTCKVPRAMNQCSQMA